MLASYEPWLDSVDKMSRDNHSHETVADHGDLLGRFEQAPSGRSPDELQDMMSRLLATGASASDGPLQQAPAPSRRPRRSDTVTYRVRIDLSAAKPPLWRRLELASDPYLNEVQASSRRLSA